MDECIEAMFAAAGGQVLDGFPLIHSEVYHTGLGTPYLRRPGISMLAKPAVNITTIQPFLDGFADALDFRSYTKDQVELPPGTQLAKAAGQLCYLSFGRGHTRNERADRYFANLKESGHGSVLEHASFSFLLYGVSRSLTHELVRHRAGTGFSQASQRYVDGSVLRFVERPEFRDDATLHREFEKGIDEAASRYSTVTRILMEQQGLGNSWLSGEKKRDLRKRVQQAARSCLPNDAEAPVIFTGNARALRHTIEMRASEHAEVEIRELFFRLFLCLRVVEPLLVDDYEVIRLADGTFAIDTKWRKV